MRSIIGILILVLVGMRPVLLPGTAGATADALDQYQTVQNSWGMVGAPRVGQVFTVGQYGYLDRVSVYLAKYPADPPTGYVSASIQTVTSEGVPSGIQIGSGRIPAGLIQDVAAWVDIDIDQAFVSAGTRYALVLSTSGITPFTGGGIVQWYMNTSEDLYTNGDLVVNSLDTWATDLGVDAAFKTYVIPNTLDQSQSQTSGAGGGTRALGSTPVGQTFTADMYGILNQVSVYITNSSYTPAPITVTIQTVTLKGLPSGVEIARGTIPAEDIPNPGYRSWASASITPLMVTPGTRYALLLSTDGSGPMWILVSDVYPGGTQVIFSGAIWTTKYSDFAFQTYVLPPTLDQSQTDFTYGSYFGNGWHYGQSFTAHVSGLLDGVSVVLGRPNYQEYNPTADVTVRLFEYPSWTWIGSAIIPLSSVPGPGAAGWLDVSFDGVYVKAGSQYALVLDENSDGYLWWWHSGNTYSGGTSLCCGETSLAARPADDMAFKTYVLPVRLLTTGPGPGNTPCADGVCPQVSGGFTPADLTDGVTSHFRFRERSDGTVEGILNFSDSGPGGIELRGCTTVSAACRLTVKDFVCTDRDSITVRGTYIPQGGWSTTPFLLNLSGEKDEMGTFTLNAGAYSYSFTGDGIVDVTCPPDATY